MRLLLITLMLLIFALPSNAAIDYKNMDRHLCGAFLPTNQQLVDNKRKVEFRIICNSPYGFRAYIQNPINGTPVRDIASGDGPVNQRFSIIVNENEFWAYRIAVRPATN